MSGHRGRFGLIAFFMLVFLGACGAHAQADGISAAIADRIIVPEGQQLSEPAINLISVQRGAIEGTVQLPATIEFPSVRTLSFSGSGGLFSGAYITEPGTTVQEGDLLAEQFFQEHDLEPQRIAGYRQAFQLEQFEGRFVSDYRSRTQEIAEARNALNTADEGDSEIMALRLAVLELALERFLFERDATRRNMQERLANTHNTMSGEQLYAPFDGILTGISQVTAGSTVSPGHSFFTIVDDGFFWFRVNASPDMVKYGKTYTMVSTDGRLSFEVIIVSDPLISGSRANSIEFILKPADISALEDSLRELDLTIFDMDAMSFLLTVEETFVTDALILPARSLRQEDQRESVLIYDDGRLKKRYIARGIQFRNDVEILMGVSEGQKVALP